MYNKLQLSLLLVFICFFTSVYSQEYLEMAETGDYSVQEIIENGEAYFADKDKGRGSGYKQFKRWEYMALRLMDQNGYLKSVTDRIATLEDFNASLNASQIEAPENLTQDNWQELGPSSWNTTSGWNPGVGRITALDVDLNNTNHIIIGANTGGVWRSLDGGQNWESLSDNFTDLRVFSVAIDPLDADTYYFGSSSGLIFKSVDAGGTWNLLTSVGFSLVNKILIHPENTDILFATSQNDGIFRSTDAGLSWNNVTTDSEGYDIEFKPDDVSVVYASGNTFHKSTDGGATFATIGSFNFGPKMIGVSPDDTTIVYLLEADFNGSFGAFYRSENEGDNFLEIDHGNANYFNLSTTATGGGGNAPRDMDIVVHPENVNEVHIAGIITWRSFNGGISFSPTSDWHIFDAFDANLGYCHADIDIMKFVGDELYIGSDGGIFKASNPSGPVSFNDYFEDLTTGLGIRQFYKIGVAQTAEQRITGGTQDNGTSIFTDSQGWREWLGADGGGTFIDKNNANILYGATQRGGLRKSTNNGASQFFIAGGLNGTASFVTPFEQDPIVSNTIYSGTDRMFKSTNGGSSWSSISQFFGASVDEFKISPSDNDILYASVDFDFYRTQDGGATSWELMTSLPFGFIRDFAIHPTNPNKVAVASSAIEGVFVTEDGGETWENLTLNLPNFAALSVVWDDNGEDGLYLGMDYGVFYIDNTRDEWLVFNANLPNVIVNELEINTVTGMIYAGTYGRGLWVSPILDPTLSTEAFVSRDDISIFPNPAKSEITIALNQPLSGDIRVYDTTGKLMIYTKDAAIDSNYKMDISRLNSGVYFVRITTTKGVVTKRILKK